MALHGYCLKTPLNTVFISRTDYHQNEHSDPPPFFIAILGHSWLVEYLCQVLLQIYFRFFQIYVIMIFPPFFTFVVCGVPLPFSTSEGLFFTFVSSICMYVKFSNHSGSFTVITNPVCTKCKQTSWYLVLIFTEAFSSFAKKGSNYAVTRKNLKHLKDTTFKRELIFMLLAVFCSRRASVF